MPKLPKLPRFLPKFSDKPLFNGETLKWLLDEGGEGCGEKLVEEAEKILKEKKKYSREKLVVMCIIAQKNWEIAMGEIERLEEEVNKLEVQIKILKKED